MLGWVLPLDGYCLWMVDWVLPEFACNAELHTIEAQCSKHQFTALVMLL
jgi:hypothetical protein